MPGPAGPAGLTALTANSRRLDRRVVLLTRTGRLVGDAIALRLRCPTGSAFNTGTVTLRTTAALHGARRTLGSASFNCPGGGSRTTHVVVRASIRKLLRRHARAVLATAFLALRDGSGALAVTTPSLRVAMGHAQR